MRRRELIQQLRQRLERNSYPRLQMLVLVLLTGFAGFITSAMLLHYGLESMGLRYLLALAVAYGVFLLLLWVWLQSRDEDFLDLSGDLPSIPGSSSPTPFHGEGGDFGGGGSSADFSFDSGAHGELPTPSEPISLLDDETGELIGETVGAVGQADELAIPLLLLLLVAALFFSSLWIVYQAPLLFAELLLDSALITTLYRRLRRMERRHWLETAVRKTALPIFITALLLSGSGWAMQHYAPRAHSLGEVIALMHADEKPVLP